MMGSTNGLKAKVRDSQQWKDACEVAARLAQTVKPRWAHDAQKFLDLDRWLDINVRRVVKLGLHEATHLDVLDLGSGNGLFLFVCEHLGHTAVGIDLPADELDPPEREIFTALPEALGVRVLRTSIRAFQPLKMSGTFDIITAFMVCFNNHKQSDEWNRAEWEYFVNDMLGLLRTGGRLALRLNHHEEKFGDRGYFDNDTRDFFRSLGTEHDGKILITAGGPA